MTPPPAVHRPQRRVGVGCLGQLALLTILGIAFVCAVDFVFAPWSYYLGGRIHIVPFWQGLGRVKTPAGDFTLYVWFTPTPGGAPFHLQSVSGEGYLCTPRGEQFRLRLLGSFPTTTGVDTNGKEMYLSLHRRPGYSLVSGTIDARPRLDLRGRWRDLELELDDGGSLSQAFLADGTLFSGRPRDQPPAREHVALVLHETAWSGWMSDCRARS